MKSFKQFLQESVKEIPSMVGDRGTRYSTDGGIMDVQHTDLKYAPRKQSVVSFEVEPEHQGKGIGKKLLKHAMSKHDDIGAQVSSPASIKVFHNAGFRNPMMPQGSFEDHEKKRKEDSSVFMAYRDHEGNKYVK